MECVTKRIREFFDPSLINTMGMRFQPHPIPEQKIIRKEEGPRRTKKRKAPGFQNAHTEKFDHYMRQHISLEEQYGNRREIVPLDHLNALLLEKHCTIEDILQLRKDQTKLLIHHAQRFEPMREKEIAKCPEHVQQIYRRRIKGSKLKNLQLFKFLLELAGHPNITELMYNLYNGFMTVGPVALSKIWDVVVSHENSDPIAEFEKQKVVLRNHPPKWTHPRNLKRLWHENCKWGETGLGHEIPASEVRHPPVYGFGVEQGESEIRWCNEFQESYNHFHKLRICYDFRAQNNFCPMTEKLKLLSNRTAIELYNIALHDGPGEPPLIVQSRKDISKDMETEKALLQTDLQQLMRRTDDLNDAAHSKKTKCQIGIPKWMSFMPFLFKLDFSQWYWQWPCRNPFHNILGVFDTDALIWRYYLAFMLAFGSLRSIAAAVQISDALVFIITRVFFICVFIYIVYLY